jgi:transcriptional regulator GlxA family with amidase domain
MASRGMKLTGEGAESDTAPRPLLEVALAHDAGTTKGGLYGLTDLFTYAGQFASGGSSDHGPVPVRITHWSASEDDASVACTFDTCPDLPHGPDLIIVPNNHRAIVEPGRDSAMVAWLAGHHARGAVLAGVCGGVFMLARTGLLSGRKATTHWAFADTFSTLFPDVVMESDQMVIDHGDLVTAGGALAWADLGLRLTERFLGSRVMHETAHYMNVDPPGREQRFYDVHRPAKKHGDTAILKVQDWMDTQRDRVLAVAELARVAGLEPRTFLRRFVNATGLKPSVYLQRTRVARARELLEFSGITIEAIAAKVGYEDARGFRRVFRGVVGLTPSEYRRRFSTRGGPGTTPEQILP